jgi:hypothetical protein
MEHFGRLGAEEQTLQGSVAVRSHNDEVDLFPVYQARDLPGNVAFQL